MTSDALIAGPDVRREQIAAAMLYCQGALADEFPDFLTFPAYDLID